MISEIHFNSFGSGEKSMYLSNKKRLIRKNGQAVLNYSVLSGHSIVSVDAIWNTSSEDPHNVTYK